MNSEILDEDDAFSMSNKELVESLVRVAGHNNEYDCRDSLDVLTQEILRRLEVRRDRR